MEFKKTVKAVNSQWDGLELAMSMDNDGHHYRTFCIVSKTRQPTMDECLAIAEYLGYGYGNGLFYKEVL